MHTTVVVKTPISLRLVYNTNPYICCWFRTQSTAKDPEGIDISMDETGYDEEVIDMGGDSEAIPIASISPVDHSHTDEDDEMLFSLDGV